MKTIVSSWAIWQPIVYCADSCCHFHSIYLYRFHGDSNHWSSSNIHWYSLCHVNLCCSAARREKIKENLVKSFCLLHIWPTIEIPFEFAGRLAGAFWSRFEWREGKKRKSSIYNCTHTHEARSNGMNTLYRKINQRECSYHHQTKLV